MYSVVNMHRIDTFWKTINFLREVRSDLGNANQSKKCAEIDVMIIVRIGITSKIYTFVHTSEDYISLCNIYSNEYKYEIIC